MKIKDLALLSTRQLLFRSVLMLRSQRAILKRLDFYIMGDLTTSIESLKGAVDTVAVRWASQMEPLLIALTEAQAALEAMTVQDEADKAALTTALANASEAADAINAEVDELNALGAAPDVPVETVPVEELPPAPSEEETDSGTTPSADPDGGVVVEPNA